MTVLYRFHKALMIAACFGAIFTFVWSIHSYQHGGGGAAIATAIASALVPALLAVYLKIMWKKYR